MHSRHATLLVAPEQALAKQMPHQKLLTCVAAWNGIQVACGFGGSRHSLPAAAAKEAAKASEASNWRSAPILRTAMPIDHADMLKSGIQHLQP